MDKEQNSKNIIDEATEGEYKYGFVTNIDTHVIPKGLNEDVVRYISSIKGEPEWLLDFRLRAYRHWQKLEMPRWAHLDIPPIDFNDISYYAAPKQKEGPRSMDEVDPELRKTFDKLGISLEEQMRLSGVAVDAVMDSVSVKTTYKERLAELGVIFCSISEAVRGEGAWLLNLAGERFMYGAHELAELARKHNDANVLALPARFIEPELAIEVLKTFFSNDFEGGRHQRRVEKIPLREC